MKIIKTEGQSKLVQLENGKRVILPIWSDDIEMSVPVDLWDIITMPDVAQFLIKNKIYTYHDLYRRSDLASTILGLGQDYYQLLSKAKGVNNG